MPCPYPSIINQTINLSPCLLAVSTQGFRFFPSAPKKPEPPKGKGQNQNLPSISPLSDDQLDGLMVNKQSHIPNIQTLVCNDTYFLFKYLMYTIYLHITIWNINKYEADMYLREYYMLYI